MRAIATLCVFAGHTVTGTYTLAGQPSLFALAADLNYEGVAIFFLISGFLLYRPFLTARLTGRPLSLRDYGRRRFLRIVPAYWVALSVFLALGMVGGVNGGNWWQFYGFAQIYSFGTLGRGMGAAWTLCIEVTFYVALPVFVFLAARLGRRRTLLGGDIVLLFTLASASLVFRAHFPAFADVATVSTLPGTFFWFALGMALALMSVTAGCRSAFDSFSARWPGWPVLSWLLAGMAFMGVYVVQHAGAELGPPVLAVGMHVLYAVAAFLVLLPGVFAERLTGPVTSLLRLRVLGWIGLVSYGVYLYHPVVIAQLATASRNWGGRYPFIAVASLVVTLVCAAVSYYALERPLMTWGRRRRRPDPPAG
jgi:peptidoglycan/LPS O-acetylase OafA/YrhL